MNNNYAIEIKDLKKAYGRNKVLKGLNLKIPKGAIYAYLGENGSGKTTTINLILNLLNPDSGSINVLGLDSRKNEIEVRRKIGYVAEFPVMYEWMKVKEIMGFAKSFYPRWDDTRVNNLIKDLEIPLDKKISEFSKGMKAKVALVLAMAHKPEILIFDDPTSGLDANARRQFVQVVLSLVEEEKVTVFFSSHLITELERMADHVGLLQNGILRFEMPLEELKNKVKKIKISFKGDDIRALLPEALKPKIIKSGKSLTGWDMVLENYTPEDLKNLKNDDAKNIEVIDLELEDIFVNYCQGKNNGK